MKVISMGRFTIIINNKIDKATPKDNELDPFFSIIRTPKVCIELAEWFHALSVNNYYRMENPILIHIKQNEKIDSSWA